MASETAAAWHLVGVTGSARGQDMSPAAATTIGGGGAVVSTGVSGTVLLSTAVVSLDEGGTLELSTSVVEPSTQSVSRCSINNRCLAAGRGHRFSAARVEQR